MIEDPQLKCHICNKIATLAVETTCCSKIYCLFCLQNTSTNSKKCPNCSSLKFNFKESFTIRNIISSLPVQCSFCSFSTTQSLLPSHTSVCELNPSRRCAICLLPFDKISSLSHHVATNHKKEFLQKFDSSFQQYQRKQRQQQDPFLFYSNTSNDESDTNIESNQQKRKECEDKMFLPIKNRKGKSCHLGTTGKYYCGEKIFSSLDLLTPSQSMRCKCCDKYCGPTDGCNCVDCMLLDIQTRNLKQGIEWVNRDGAVSRVVSFDNITTTPNTTTTTTVLPTTTTTPTYPQDGRGILHSTSASGVITGKRSEDSIGEKLFCGRRMNEKDSDKICSPYFSYQCSACLTLESQIPKRYSEIK